MKYVSVASCWEVAIKLNMKKLELSGGIREFYSIIEENGFIITQITEAQLAVIETLPFYHKDPFDRLLVSTAIANDLILLTADSQMEAYKKEELQLVSSRNRA